LTAPLQVALDALTAIAALALATWLVSVGRRDASLADRMWPAFIAAAAIVCWRLVPSSGLRADVMLALVLVWALRLGVYVTRRNWGHGEDRRYRAIRARNEPGFAWKSLYLVFGLQGVLAWLIAAPIAAAIGSAGALGVADLLGASLAVFGIGFETLADAQLARFKADPASKGKVLDTGLWRYTRHPNYFGEFCVWWGLFAIAAGAGGAWTIFSPLLMSVLLLKVSGVTLLERDIGERRPAYRDYIARTNAFFPGPRRPA